MRFVTAFLVTSLLTANGNGSAGEAPRKVPTTAQRRAEAIRKLALDQMVARKERYEEYRGTILTLDPEVKLPQAFATQLMAADPKPPARLAHFEWLNHRGELRCNGWNATIAGATPIDGGYIVRITVRPLLEIPTGGSVLTPCFFEERYEFTEQGIRYIDGTGEHSPPVAMLIYN